MSALTLGELPLSRGTRAALLLALVNVVVLVIVLVLILVLLFAPA